MVGLIMVTTKLNKVKIVSVYCREYMEDNFDLESPPKPNCHCTQFGCSRGFIRCLKWSGVNFHSGTMVGLNEVIIFA